MASSRPESHFAIVVFRGTFKARWSCSMPDVLQLYILCVHDFNILNLMKKKTNLFNHVSSLKLSVIFQASFFLEKFDRERKIH